MAAGGGRTVWAATAEGVARLDGDERTVLPQHGYVTGGERVAIDALVVDEDGPRWMGTTGGVARFDGDEWAAYTLGAALGVTAVTLADDGTVRTGSESSVAAFDGESWEMHSTTPDRVEHDPVLALDVVDDGTLWADTRGQGVWEIPRDE